MPEGFTVRLLISSYDFVNSAFLFDKIVHSRCNTLSAIGFIYIDIVGLQCSASGSCKIGVTHLCTVVGIERPDEVHIAEITR